ncbi:MAG: hypothetical protein MZV70_69455 [Desulfobacterales bacterium]|nr:hypothetical protein [Desulfobacterales bacterium]
MRSTSPRGPGAAVALHPARSPPRPAPVSGPAPLPSSPQSSCCPEPDSLRGLRRAGEVRLPRRVEAVQSGDKATPAAAGSSDRRPGRQSVLRVHAWEPEGPARGIAAHGPGGHGPGRPDGRARDGAR